MIRFRDLRMGYTTDQLVLSIDDAKITGPNHVALVGPNGAGKSTLLLLLAGLIEPTEGTVTINRHLAGSPSAREILSFIPDQPALFDDLTLTEQMSYVAKLSGTDGPGDFALELIDRLDARELLDRFPRTLSKGQRQKAGLLVATSRPFEVLLLDEPTAGLDKTSHARLIEAIGELAQDALVIASTHDVDLLASATVRAELNDGGLVITDAPGSDG